MGNCFELLFTIFGFLVLITTVPIIMKRGRGNKLPKGSIMIEKDIPTQKNKAPGRRWTQIAVAFGILYTYFIFIDTVFHCIFGYWESYPIIYFPIWVNWIGIIGIWFVGIWATITFTYNVNYTPCTNPMKVNYVLATGGTYKYVRHPAYIAGLPLNLFTFMATGNWLTLIGLIGFIALPYQAKEEEKRLEKIFGERYADYASKTGRFFPKILLDKT